MEEQNKSPVKRKSNGKNSPVIGENGFDITPGDNSTAVKDMLYIYSMPKINVDSDAEVEQRIQDYFSYCIDRDIRPGVEGMAMALGVNRRTLWDWEQGNTRNSSVVRSDIIRKGKQFLALYLENLAQNGKINPVTWIFMMKNHFGYKDSQDINIIPTNNNDTTVPLDDIKKLLQDQHDKSFVVDVDGKEV